MDIRKTIDSTPMGGFQWYIVGLATFLNALDGYDVLAMAFTANAVSAEFGLNGSQLGALLSAGLVGMALGSLILGPFADRFGRRRLLIFSMILNFLGLALSATAGSVWELGVWRVLTGLGIGGILATVTVITSEYSNNRNRGMAVSIYTAGYSLGATLGGLAAAELIPALGWRSVFFAGAVATAAALLLVVVSLPESVDYLRVRQPDNAEIRIQKIARRLGKSGTVTLGPPELSTTGEQVKLSALITGPLKMTTYKLWAAFFFIMFGFYFANSWTPKLLVESGMTENQGIIGGLALTLGGMFGAVLYGVITIRLNARYTLMAFTVLSALTLVVFITTTSIPTLAFLSGVLVGMLINGCMAGLYTVTPASYPSALRTTGVGWGIGIGRFGAIFAPITVGALLDAGWTPFYLYTGVAVVVVLAAVSLIGIRPYLGTGSPAPSSSAIRADAVEEEAAPTLAP